MDKRTDKQELNTRLAKVFYAKVNSEQWGETISLGLRGEEGTLKGKVCKEKMISLLFGGNFV